MFLAGEFGIRLRHRQCGDFQLVAFELATNLAEHGMVIGMVFYAPNPASTSALAKASEIWVTVQRLHSSSRMTV
jgi:hypothetical protein